jgi:hypothetical protein
MVNKKRKFAPITKGLTKDVKESLHIGKKIMKKKHISKKFKVPNIKLVKTYGKPTKGIL